MLVAVNADSEPYTAHFDAGCGRAVDLITGKAARLRRRQPVCPRTARLIGAWSKRTRKMAEKNAGVRRIRPDARAVLRFLKRTNA